MCHILLQNGQKFSFKSKSLSHSMSITNKIFKNDVFRDARIAGLALVGDLQLGINLTDILVWMNCGLLCGPCAEPCC